MFFFKKNKKENDKINKQVEVNKEIEVNKEELIVELKNKEKELDKTLNEDRIGILNELGSKYFSINEIDKAINFYEQSIIECKDLGRAYTDLIKLYNIKRKEALEQKNDEQVKFYMDKIDDLMKMSKDSIRGKF